LQGGQERQLRKSELPWKRQELRRKRQELRMRRKEAPSKKDWAVLSPEWKRQKKRLQQEIFQLDREIRAIKEGWTDSEEPVTGALPDFLVIGGKKCGTTFFYHLLSQHPYIEPAASKELHYFSALYEQEDTEWYRHCFPAPRIKDGRRTITGEATPYMPYSPAPKNVARIAPRARLIALLRNPVDRTYSDYQMMARRGQESRSFEEAIGLGGATGAEKEVRPLDEDSKYLSRSVYVDHLMRWSEYFPREQMLVLKSEDFFERPQEILELTFDFLGLPGWEFEALEIVPKRRNAGDYARGMDPLIERRLEEYFEPHNKRLYEFLGVDYGW
jgi:hypothetical protein